MLVTAIVATPKESRLKSLPSPTQVHSLTCGRSTASSPAGSHKRTSNLSASAYPPLTALPSALKEHSLPNSPLRILVARLRRATAWYTLAALSSQCTCRTSLSLISGYCRAPSPPSMMTLASCRHHAPAQPLALWEDATMVPRHRTTPMMCHARALYAKLCHHDRQLCRSHAPLRTTNA